MRFGFGLGIIFLTFKTFGNNFNISHRKAPLLISSAARLDVRKDTEVPDPCVSYVSVLFFYDGLEVLLGRAGGVGRAVEAKYNL